MISKVIGGVLLIIGTSIGAGMLALPVATASGGFYNSVLLFLGAWFITVIGAFFILEANLWLPENTNLISMARKNLGAIGQLVTWISYLLLLYSLLSAYTAGGADLLTNLFKFAHLNVPNWLSSILFTVILGAAVYKGVYVVDLTNRSLMAVKLTAYVLLVLMVLPHVEHLKLLNGNYKLLGGAIMVVITSFGYATIIPSLRYYFKSNVNALRLTIALASLSSLVIYILWVLAVQGTVPSNGPDGLVPMMTSGHTASDITTALSGIAKSKIIPNLTRLFTAVCITTSFLGVALCLSDFLSDGFRVEKKSLSGKWLVTLGTFLPPLLLVLFYPGVFIAGLTYAGIFCVILLILLPALMVWSGRYIKKNAHGYKTWGGKPLVALEIIISVALLIYAIVQVF